MREDLVNKMCRNCVRLPNNNLDIPNHVSNMFEHGYLNSFTTCKYCSCRINWLNIFFSVPPKIRIKELVLFSSTV